MKSQPHRRHLLAIEEKKIRIVPGPHRKLPKSLRCPRGQLEILNDGVMAAIVPQEDFDFRVVDNSVDGLALEEVVEALRNHPHREVELAHLAPASTEESLAHVIGAQKLM